MCKWESYLIKENCSLTYGTIYNLILLWALKQPWWAFLENIYFTLTGILLFWKKSFDINMNRWSVSCFVPMLPLFQYFLSILEHLLSAKLNHLYLNHLPAVRLGIQVLWNYITGWTLWMSCLGNCFGMQQI